MRKGDDHLLQDKLGMFREICKARGIRLTHQRLELFREMATAKNHPSAEDIFKRIKSKMPTISLDTVYRTLATFERHGIIVRLQILGERGRFDSNRLPHHHFVCVQCKRIGDFNWPRFDKIEVPTEAEDWGRVSSRHAELRGICNECLRKERKQSR